jgi:hypothetical protein
MTQYVINIGALPNDGTGDPLRTAFNETNLNFDQVFAAGPVLSNVQIANNTILTTNTNGNLILAPNGIGVVQANVNVVPNMANIRNLGAADRRWNTLYTQYANISSGLAVANLTATGNVVVGGNLSVTGNVINIGNLVTDAKTIQLANTAGTDDAADGSGITVGANDAIATMLYSSASNSWVMNIGIDTPNIVVNNISSDDSTFVTIQEGLDVQGQITAETVSVAGNVTANYFAGDGSQLTNLPAPTVTLDNTSTGDIGVMIYDGVVKSVSYVTIEPASGNLKAGNISAAGNITANYFFGNGSQLTGLPAGYANANAVAYGESGWAGNIVPSGNAVYSLGNATNQWNDLYVSNATIFMNNVPISLTAGNVLTVNGNAVLQNNSNSSITTTGNITAGYFIGDGSQLSNVASTGDITFDGATISAPDDEVIRIQAKDDDSVVRSLFRLDPDNGYAEMRALSSQRNQGFATGDWATGVWTGIENNAQLAFTGATDIVNFLDNEFSGSTNQTISVNGGEPMALGGYSSGGNNVTFFVDVAPPTDPTTITSIEFNYYYSSRIEIDNDDDEINIRGNGLNININSDESVDIGAANSVEIVSDTIVSLLNNSATNPIIIRTSNGNTNQTWEFDATGNLNLPGATAGETIATQSGYITVGNLLIGQGGSLFNSNNDSWALYGNLSDPGTVIFIPSDADAGNGLPLYIESQQSNVEIRSGSSTWNFGNTSNLTLPLGGIVYETSIPGGALTGNTIALKPQGGTNADQQLLVYPTALGADANHLHLTSGNLYNTELFLGNDDLYVKLANTGNVVINSNNGTGNTAQWTFGTAGTILNSGNLILQTPNGVPGVVTAITGSSGSWESNPRNNLATAGGTGTGLTVNVTETGGYASAIAIATPGTGYSNGDSISVVSGSSDASFTISVLANGWTFTTTGNLTLPGNVSAVGNITGNYILGNGSQLTGLPATYGNANVATFLAAYGSNTITTTGNITAGNIIGNISITGNVIGTQPNVTLVAGSYDWTFDNTGNLTLPGNTFAVNYANNTPVDVVTRFEGTWTVPTGNSTQSFTVTGNNSYQMWAQGNIPNGIIVWNATVSVTNTNVPVIGQQFAWNYEGGGNILMLTSIPAQIIGTAGAIANAQPAVANTNVFSFGINNTSGGNVTVRYGWIQIS